MRPLLCHLSYAAVPGAEQKTYRVTRQASRRKQTEHDAAELLVEAGVRFPNGVTATPRPLLESALADALLFVATDPDDRPVGFLAAHQRDGGRYVGEIDVARAWPRRGIGHMLMAAAIGEARTRRRLWGAMLTTDHFVVFRHIWDDDVEFLSTSRAVAFEVTRVNSTPNPGRWRVPPWPRARGAWADGDPAAVPEGRGGAWP